MLESKEFVFIIGAPRSGSTWLQIMMGAHPSVCTTVELSLYNRYTAPWLRAFQKEQNKIDQGRWHQGLPTVWSREELLGFLRFFLQSVYSKVLQRKPGATHLVDKQPLYSEHVMEINELLPQSRFIHLIRDGRDVAVSMRAARQEMGFGPDTMDECARYWVQQVRFSRLAKQFGDRYTEVTYRELLEDGPNTMQRLFEFSGLSIKPAEATEICRQHEFAVMKERSPSGDPDIALDPKHYRKGRRGSWREDMSALDRVQFNRVAGQLLQELGFVKDSAWVSEGFSLRQRLSAPIVEKTRGARRRIGKAIAALRGQ